MCEAHAYIIKGDKEERLLANVDQIDVEGDEVRMINIFGEQKIIKAKIKSYNNSESKIVLEALG
ncbi:CooT family nickel-binding protein [Thermodesulfobacteriota bacterium]